MELRRRAGSTEQGAPECEIHRHLLLLAAPRFPGRCFPASCSTLQLPLISSSNGGKLASSSGSIDCLFRLLRRIGKFMANETTGAGRAKYVPFALTKEVVTEMFPVETEPKISTMDKPLIIESACPGWQLGEKRFPAVPVALKDQIREQVDSLRAGAVIAHIHPRDPKTGLAQMNQIGRASCR